MLWHSDNRLDTLNGGHLLAYGFRNARTADYMLLPITAATHACRCCRYRGFRGG